MKKDLPKPVEEHVHRWRIETPEGVFSDGVCGCGARRRFVNTFELDLKGADFRGRKFDERRRS